MIVAVLLLCGELSFILVSVGARSPYCSSVFNSRRAASAYYVEPLLELHATENDKDVVM